MKRTLCDVVLALCLFPFAGCLHAPPAGATQGIVEIKNTQVRDGNNPDQFVLHINTLTGVVIGEHTVLTVAHTFEDEPSSDHQITIDGRAVEYAIIADGWGGLRSDQDLADKPAEMNDIQEDYLLLKATESFSDIAQLVPLEYERADELRDLYLVTRRVETGKVEAMLAKRVSFVKDLRYILVDLPGRAHEGFYLSGSPLIGTYEDGTLVLVGIVKGTGDLLIESDGVSKKFDHQLFVFPAYRIPFDQITEP